MYRTIHPGHDTKNISCNIYMYMCYIGLSKPVYARQAGLIDIFLDNWILQTTNNFVQSCAEHRHFRNACALKRVLYEDAQFVCAIKHVLSQHYLYRFRWETYEYWLLYLASSWTSGSLETSNDRIYYYPRRVSANEQMDSTDYRSASS